MKNSMTQRAASRIQSAASKKPASLTSATLFNRRAQAAASKGKGGWPSTTPKPSGGNRDNNTPKK